MAEIFTFRFGIRNFHLFCCINCLRVLFRVVLFSHIISGSHQTFQSVLGINRSFQLSYQAWNIFASFRSKLLYHNCLCFCSDSIDITNPVHVFFIKALLAELDSRILGMNFLSVFYDIVSIKTSEPSSLLFHCALSYFAAEYSTFDGKNLTIFIRSHS